MADSEEPASETRRTTKPGVGSDRTIRAPCARVGDRFRDRLLHLLLFASAYIMMEHVARASFGEPLTHTDALYFTVTVFTTVGFGDITAHTEAARLLVTFQMITDVIVIGLGIQAIIEAARRRGRAGQPTR